MSYRDWKPPKGSFRCETCQLLIPNEKKGPHLKAGCEFAKTSEADKEKCRQIAESLDTLEGLQAGEFRSLVIVISYGALVAGGEDLETIATLAAKLNQNSAHGSLAVARLPETIRQLAAKGKQWEGFRGELGEFARRAEKAHVVRIGAMNQTHLRLLVDAKGKIGDEVFNAAYTQLKSLDERDELGGDVIDFSKKKVVQVKYLTGTREATLREKLQEAAEQLVGELKPANEVPIDGFRREISIIIANPDSPFATADVPKFRTAVEDVMNLSVRKETGSGTSLDHVFHDGVGATFSYFVETVRIETPTKKVRFVRGREDANRRSVYLPKPPG